MREQYGSQDVRIPSLAAHERESAVSWIDFTLSNIAESINRDANFKFVCEDGRISMEAFSSLYNARERKDDRRILVSNRIYYSGISDTEPYRKIQTEGGNVNPSENQEIRKLLETYEQETKKQDGHLAEAIATIVLHKVVGEHFLVVRSSEHDDYENGVDTLIVDKGTGEVICAFDEVVGGSEGINSERYQKKIARSKEAIRRHGGMRIKYGVTYSHEEGQPEIRLRAFDHVPTFCLSFERHELYSLVRSMSRELTVMDDAEQSFLSTLAEKLEAQKRDFQESGFEGEAEQLSRFCTTLRENLSHGVG